ncbi:uncharacterized protein LOC127119860 isoform X2 [Lathyrus oleraceus]|uniref:uncharacterized protein LOC127119860 isoform X2 n=1 Tax=Pisum sativum TaxID=3888 RepID=UPI0021D13F81|nr:uncharacterized protein LOC127119860 isoform X2 [Pisum sativum]
MAEEEQHDEMKKLFSSYIGLSFSVFLALLPNKLREHSLRAFRAEEELSQIKSRRQEDYKANARVAEIFASHRNSWRDEEKRLLRRIDSASEEIDRLRAMVEDSKARVEELEREVVERDDMIGFISRRFQEEGLGGCGSREHYGGNNYNNSGGTGAGGGGGGGGGGEWFHKEEDEMVGTTADSRVDEEVDVIYQQHLNNGFDSEFIASSGSKFWAEKASLWQDVQYESLESMYNTKEFVARESPWKVDGDSAGVSSKLKLLEQELLNLEKISKDVPSKVSSSIKKQAKRFQSLSEKIDDLCRRIASDPCEPSLGSEFRTQTQTEFLLEAFRLQQGASETGQKLMALHTEVGKTHYRDELRGETTLTTRRSLDSIRNNFRELQRNLEIWLARIIGDLEGILARDGASRVREYYISRYPFVQ